MTAAGFTISGDNHPISPVMLGDAKLASDFADAMLQEGIYVIGKIITIFKHKHENLQGRTQDFRRGGAKIPRTFSFPLPLKCISFGGGGEGC